MNTENTARKQRGRPFPKGQSGNPNGRPLGSTNFETDFEEVVNVIAKRDHKTKSKVRQELLVVAYDMAKKGQFQFFKELIDRKYGKVPDKVDMTSKGEKIEFNPLMEEYAQNALRGQKEAHG